MLHIKKATPSPKMFKISQNFGASGWKFAPSLKGKTRYIVVVLMKDLIHILSSFDIIFFSKKNVRQIAIKHVSDSYQIVLSSSSINTIYKI